MYTIATLIQINESYHRQHYLTQSDVNKANMYVNIIQQSRTDETPQAGDIVEFTTKHGDYYKNAHIESYYFDTTQWSICEQPYVPFIGLTEDKINIRCNTSGGAWSVVPNNLKLIGKRLKTFCDWGHCGACGNGAIHFEAEVNVWEYKEPDALYGDYTTKDYRKQYISYRADEFGYPINGSSYVYFGEGIAFRNRTEYEAWLKTYKGVEFKGNWQNQTVVFIYEEIEHYISEDEWNKLDLPIDTRMCNGTILVKVKYDDESHCIDTYRYTNDGIRHYGIYPVYKLVREKV